MTHQFEPFAPEEFKKATGIEAIDNEGIYLRWVNSQVNYANYINMQQMAESLKEICAILKEQPLLEKRNNL